MTDEKRMFIEDSREKKITARSARYTRTHCGKSGSVKFPSDYLTRKELKAMSGECIKYKSLKGPMSWDDFKALPNDLKVEYITNIRERFGAPDKYIAEMFGISASTMALWMRDLHCGVGNTGHGNGAKKWEKEKFLAWRTGADENLVEGKAAVEPQEAVEAENVDVDVSEEIDISNEAPESTEGVVEDADDVQEYSLRGATEEVVATPVQGCLTFECPADQAMNMIRVVLGNANVKIKIEWEVVE